MNIYQNISEENIYNLLQQPADDIGYDIVRVKMNSNQRSSKLQIMIERLDSKPITVNDCQKVSNAFSAILDVEDVIEEKYHLEISSTGVNKPLTRVKDYQGAIGQKVKIATFMPVFGRKKLVGVLTNCGEDALELKLLEEQELVEIKFNAIKDGKLLKI